MRFLLKLYKMKAHFRRIWDIIRFVCKKEVGNKTDNRYHKAWSNDSVSTKNHVLAQEQDEWAEEIDVPIDANNLLKNHTAIYFVLLLNFQALCVELSGFELRASVPSAPLHLYFHLLGIAWRLRKEIIMGLKISE